MLARARMQGTATANLVFSQGVTALNLRLRGGTLPAQPHSSGLRPVSGTRTRTPGLADRCSVQLSYDGNRLGGGRQTPAVAASQFCWSWVRVFSSALASPPIRLDEWPWAPPQELPQG